MSELAFFKRGRGLTIGEIAALTGAIAAPGVQLDRRIDGIAALDRAGPDDLAFMDSAKFADQLAGTRAGVCLTSERFAARAPAGLNVLTSPDPYPSFVTVAQTLFPQAMRPSSLYEVEGRSDDALIHPAARFESGVTVDPGAVIGPRAEIGAGSVIGANAVVGAEVRIGRDCAIGAGVTVANALIGDRVIIHPGCRIGQDGFGYTPGPTGLRKIPQIGRVIIQNDVEIGANSTIDRGGVRDTVIGEGTKIDNLVQIAHNVVIGRHCIIVSMGGISGSVTIGDRVMLGGQVGVADNVTIGEGAQVAAKSGVMSNVPSGARWGGVPAQPMRDFLRAEALLRRQAQRVAPDEGETND